MWTMIGPSMTLRRVHPAPAGPTTADEAYAVERPPPAGRPWIGLCMVASLDGSVVVDGRSGGLGNANDLAVLLALRRLADLVLVGAGTVRAEGYGPPRKPGQRIAVATRSGGLDLTTSLFTSGAAIVLAPRSADVDEARVEVIRAGDHELDLPAALEALTARVPGLRHVHAEGGPRLNGTLLGLDLVDELALTLSPRLVGGAGARVVAGAGGTDRAFSLAHLLVDDDGYVFGRWVRARPASP